MVAVVIICNYLDTKFIVFSSKKKKKSQITYLLQCFSLFRAQVSDSSAHVYDHKMKTELLQSQMNRQAQSQKRKNTVSVRGRRVCESDACPWCSSTASVSCYPRCQLPVEETAVGGGGGGEMSTRQSHSPSEDPVRPADSVKDKRNDMRITRNKKQELQRGEVPPPL